MGAEYAHRWYATPGRRIAGAALALLGSDDLGRDGSTLATASAALLDSLEANGRFVRADAMARMGKSCSLQPDDPAILLRCLPLALWLRGPNERIALAAVRLAETLGADVVTGLSCAFACQWLRNLYARRIDARGWQSTLEDMDEITEFMGTDPQLWLEVRSRLHDPAARGHRVTLALRQVLDAVLAENSPAALMAHLEFRGAQFGALALGRCVVGMIYGVGGMETIRTTQELADEHRKRLARLGERGARLYRLERWPPETSATHPLPLARITLETGGQILLSGAPGLSSGPNASLSTSQRDLGADIERIASAGVHHVVCLMAADELIDGEMENLAPWLEAHDIRFSHLPEVAGADNAWFQNECERVIPELAAALAVGQRVLVHGDELTDPRAATFAEQILLHAQPTQSSDESAQRVRVALELAQIDFQRHDQDE